jgi:hypothetical protein
VSAPALTLVSAPDPTASARATAAARAAVAAAEMVDPIGLAELMELAELQTRVDRKYFVPAEDVPNFVELWWRPDDRSDLLNLL